MKELQFYQQFKLCLTRSQLLDWLMEDYCCDLNIILNGDTLELVTGNELNIKKLICSFDREYHNKYNVAIKNFTTFKLYVEGIYTDAYLYSLSQYKKFLSQENSTVWYEAFKKIAPQYMKSVIKFSDNVEYNCSLEFSDNDITIHVLEEDFYSSLILNSRNVLSVKEIMCDDKAFLVKTQHLNAVIIFREKI